MRGASHRILNYPAMLEVNIDYAHRSSHQGKRRPGRLNAPQLLDAASQMLLADG
jgi:hypothetical protein